MTAYWASDGLVTEKYDCRSECINQRKALGAGSGRSRAMQATVASFNHISVSQKDTPLIFECNERTDGTKRQ